MSKIRTFQSLEEVKNNLDTLTVEEARLANETLGISFVIGKDGEFTDAFQENNPQEKPMDIHEVASLEIGA